MRSAKRYIKIILVVILCTVSSLNALWAQTSGSLLKVDFRNASLNEVIKFIEQRTPYHFFYSENLTARITGLTFQSAAVSVEQLLERFLEHTPLTYTINKHLIVLKLKPPPPPHRHPPGGRFVQVSGTVSNKEGETLPGVNVYVKHLPKVGVTTDINGLYVIRARPLDTLCYSFVGYRKKELVITENLVNGNMVLKEASEYLDEVMIVGYGKQRAVSVVGAISTLNMSTATHAVTPVSNMLAGRLTGLIGVQHSGEPGANFSEFWIRGIGTFGANRKALILIDGIERDNLDDLLPEDIEHFSILKDATATAIYGARGGNGVVLVNTKRGRTGKTCINLSSRLSVETLPYLPRYLGASEYARLANEAHVVRGETPEYIERDFRIMRYHLDPDLYPDTDWQKEILKKSSLSSRSFLSITGGNRWVNFYISGNVKTNGAIYRTDEDKRNNTRRTLYGFRSNFDLVPTESFRIAFDLSAEHMRMNRPGKELTEDLWQTLTEVTPLSAPIRFTNGLFAAYGKENKMAPTTLLYETGYRHEYSTAFQSRLTLTKELNRWVKGLSVEATVSFDNRHVSMNQNVKNPALYKLRERKWQDAEPVFEKCVEAMPLTYSSESENRQSVYLEGKLSYGLTWDKSHQLNAMILYNQRSYVVTSENELEAIPFRNQGLAGRVAYSYRDVYFTELNFGYTGTENFPRHERFGFFPSAALGWVISNYPLFRRKYAFFNLLKLRYSIGLVGNDKILNKRFPDLTFVDFNAEGFVFGDLGENIQGGVTEQEIGSGRIKWEVSRKRNLGLDLNLRNRLFVSFDWYHDYRKGIFMRRESLPDIIGVSPKPYGNWGEMKNWGFDGNITLPVAWKQWKCELSGTLTYTRDKIEQYEEAVPDYPYQKHSGNWNIMSRGLIALGLFKDEEDVRNSPPQFGEVLPGDIKYKDVNGDGVVDDDDIVPIGYGEVPKLQYGLTVDMAWKNFYCRLFFRGAGRVNFFYGGAGFYPFAERENGNVLAMVDRPGERWIPASYSGNAATENPAARFPRLTYGENLNNNRPSTFWMANGSYFRFKNIEIGYQLPRQMLSKLNLTACQLSFIGDNLAVWPKVKLWDPEQTSPNGAVYPIPRSYTFALSVSF